MENISNCSNNVWTELQSLYKLHPSYIVLLLVLLCIPMGYAVSSIAVGLFVLITLFGIKISNIKFRLDLLFPILYFVLASATYFWSIDQEATLKAISKLAPFLVIPGCLMLLPSLDRGKSYTIFKVYSYGIVGYSLFYLLRSLIKYISTGEINAFFYHELVTEDVNAIHVSVYTCFAFFYFFTKSLKSKWDKALILLLGVFIFLLSSKNIIVIFLSLILLYELFFFKVTSKIKLITFLLVGVLGFLIFNSSKIRDRFLIEFESTRQEGTLNKSFTDGPVYNVTISQAWNKNRFEQNEYFSGAPFRIYQARLFCEMLQEDPIFFSGYGLNATDQKIAEKGVHYNVFLGNNQLEGYHKKNFHNQYIQTFAELGIFGLLILLCILFTSLKQSVQKKDFIHFCFTVLMISLFLTESFLARQRGILFFVIIYSLYAVSFNNKLGNKES